MSRRSNVTLCLIVIGSFVGFVVWAVRAAYTLGDVTNYAQHITLAVFSDWSADELLRNATAAFCDLDQGDQIRADLGKLHDAVGDMTKVSVAAWRSYVGTVGFEAAVELDVECTNGALRVSVALRREGGQWRVHGMRYVRVR